MSDSDEEYHADSDDDFHSFGNDGAGSGHATRSTKLLKGDNRGVERDGKTRKRRAWEEVQRAWDNVVEGEDGTLTSAIDGLLEAEKRQR
jgi:transcription initiation factor TFIIH subunit 2